MESGKPTLRVRCERGVLEVVFKDTIPSSPRLTDKIVIGLVRISGSPEGIQTRYLLNKRNQIQDRFDKTNQEALPTCSSEINTWRTHMQNMCVKKMWETNTLFLSSCIDECRFKLTWLHVLLLEEPVLYH